MSHIVIGSGPSGVSVATALLAQVHLDSIWRIVEARRLCILGVIWVLDEVSIRFA